MSHLSEDSLRLLRTVAYELHEAFSERGHNIGRALGVDEAFGSGQSRGALRRDLATHSVNRTASRIGLDPRTVMGGGCEIRTIAGSVDRRYRLRSAKRSDDGTLVVLASGDSALADDPSLYRQERWVLGLLYTPDDQISQVFVAEIMGFEEGSPGRLRLGPEICLLDDVDGIATTGFVPSDDDLPGFGLGDEPGESDGTNQA